jgi:hypothetical protein
MHWGNIDAPGFQHRAVAEIDAMQLQLGELVRDPGSRPWEKTGAHANGLGAKPEIETCRLQLIGQQGLVKHDAPSLDQAADSLHRQNTGLGLRRSLWQGFGQRFGLGLGHC